MSTSSKLLIGRQRGCQMVIDDPTVSRCHAALHREAGTWILEDLGSTNGTTVNGVRIGGETRIEPGDELGLGATLIRFAPGGRRLFAVERSLSAVPAGRS